MSNSKSGFTIVEMLVATAVLCLLVVLLFQIANQTSSTWILNEGQIERRENGRAILSSITAEMQGALLSSAGRSDLQFIVNPSHLAADRKNNSAVFWQAPIATDRRLGDIAEVGYFVKWDISAPASPKAQLCRLFINPVDPTSPVLKANPLFLIYEKPNEWAVAEVLDQVAPADKQSSYAGLFSENVLGLWIRCLAPDGQTITKTASGLPFPTGSFDSRQGYTWAGGVQSANSLPAAVEIGIALIDTRAANRIKDTSLLAIQTAVRSHPTAASFVEAIRELAVFQPVRSSIRSYTTTVYLETARK
jgi:prepilin-type N-terminal cleavage/methylation domain-containing protein